MRTSLLVALAFALTSQAGAVIKLKISGAGSFSGVRNAIVKATLTNTGDEIARILNEPNTVLSKMETHTFAILILRVWLPSSRASSYVPTVSSDHTTLQPGESITVDYKLATAYDFTRSGTGKYTIETSSALTLITERGLEIIYAETRAHEAYLSGELYIPRQELSRRASFVGCTSARQTLIAAAYAGAQAYADESYAYLLNNTSTLRYTTWFDTRTVARHQVVLLNFQRLNSHAASSNTYDCTCTDSSIAYTYATVIGQMWLCNGFWSAPTLGANSKAGAIIHESVHWSAIAGAYDYSYGQSAAKSLAVSSPTTCIRNDDSYEYFAVSTPALP